MPRRRALLAAVLAVVAAALPAEAPAAEAALVPCVDLGILKAGDCQKPAPRRSDCRDADVTPTRSTMGRARRATLCLLNRERRKAGLRPLREQAALRAAARRYARQMVREDFFAHDAPDGSTLTSRIKRTSYLRHTRSWLLGENLAWGSGSQATPRRTVRNWMESPGHRANILTGRFRHIGIGITTGAPAEVPAGQRAATYVTEFGRRTLR